MFNNASDFIRRMNKKLYKIVSKELIGWLGLGQTFVCHTFILIWWYHNT